MNNNGKSKTFTRLPVLIFLGGLLFWLFGSRELNYVIAEINLLLSSAFVGIIVAVLVFWLRYERRGYSLQVKDKLLSFLLLWVGCTLFIAGIAAKINKAYASGDTREIRSQIIRKWKGEGKDRRLYISCKISRAEVQFYTFSSLWESIAEGDTVTLHIKTGVLGYNFVDEIIPEASAVPQQSTP